MRTVLLRYYTLLRLLFCIILPATLRHTAFAQPDSWQRKQPLGNVMGRGFSVSFSIGTKGYVGTGANGSYRNDFWEYDPAVNTWTQKADFAGGKRASAAGFGIGAKGYIGTGFTGNMSEGYKKDFWEYDPAVNTWTRKADFAGSARVLAVAFNIGAKGFFATGYDGVLKNDLWQYDPVTNLWIQKANFPGTARQEAVGFGIDNKGYIGTGYDGIIRKDFWEYDPANDAWIQKADFAGIARYRAIGFGVSGKGYIGTGYNAGYMKDVWAYDPGSNNWLRQADLPGLPRYNAICFSLGNRAYAGTGYSAGGKIETDFWEYAPGSNSWTEKLGFTASALFAGISFSINSKAYIGLGRALNGVTGEFWEYEPGTDSWTQLADFGGGPRIDATGFSIGNKGYAGTGADATTLVYKNDFWEYDPAVNTWTQKAAFPAGPRTAATGFSIGDKGYIGTGRNVNGGYENDFWEYNPLSDSWTQKSNFGGAARSFAASVSINSKGYLGTGFVVQQGQSFTAKDFWEYNSLNDTWTQKSDFGGAPRSGCKGFSIGNKVYLGTGAAAGLTKDFWEYDTEADSWTQRSDFGGVPRQAAVAFSIGGKGYIGTGYDDATGINDLWEYTPAGTIVPVLFLSFNATEKNAAVVLEWTTAEEHGIKAYQVEKSIDGFKFYTIANVVANRKLQVGSYCYTDPLIFGGIIYYRVKAIDEAGKYFVSPTKIVSLQSKPAISISPNPLAAAAFTVNINGDKREVYELRLFNASGQLMMKKSIFHSGGFVSNSFQLPAGWIGAGFYVVKINGQRGQAVTIKLVIAR